MKKVSLLILVLILLILPLVRCARASLLNLTLDSWTQHTVPTGHYVNIAQTSTPYGDGISVDTIGYPGAYEYDYDFFAYYNEVFVVPLEGRIEVRGYFCYDDVSLGGYVPCRQFLAVYFLKPDLSEYIRNVTRILNHDWGDLPGVWYNRRIIISDLTPGQQYRIAFGRSDLCDSDKKIKASWTSVYVGPPTLRVPEDFSTIQGAINQAVDGEVILVSSGTYLENVVVNKSVSLIGENKHDTIIDGNGIGTVINIEAKNVTVSGFTIQQSGATIYDGGIAVNSSSGNKISQNILVYNYLGIWLENSSHNIITGNNASSNNKGIFLRNSSYNILSGNNISYNYLGICLSNSSNSMIFHNNFINNVQQVYTHESDNTWNNGCEGDYWSDYNGADWNQTKCSLGIGDDYLPWQGVDYYPLMSPYIPGDINHNGMVEGLDYGILGASWGSKEGDDNWNCHCDFNMNSVIEGLDYGIFGANWERRWDAHT